MSTSDIIELVGKILIAVLGLVAAVISVRVAIKKRKGERGMGGSIFKRNKASQNQSGNNNQANTSIGDGNSQGNIINIFQSPAVSDDESEKAPDDRYDSGDPIKLEDTYTSLFAEENQLKTETIRIIKQEHGMIEGNVELKEYDIQGIPQQTLSYTMKGIFANKILTAEYRSNGSRSDERGAVNLKLIGNGILSGFCSFSRLSSADDEIRVSPYVWVEGENVDLLDGTYEFCTDCYKEKAVCCCASEEIDMPVLLDSETNAIRTLLSKKKQAKKDYSNQLPSPYNSTSVRQIRREQLKNPASTGETSKCHFFDLSSKQCKIYKGRPIDCRLFPFDIKLSANKSEYIIGYYPDLCTRPLPDFNEMKKHAHILRPYFFLLYPYLHIITDDSVCSRLKDAEFKQIATFQDFIF